MFGTFVIVLREVIEAGLVVGIVLAAARGVPCRGQWVGLGVIAGLAGACVVALFAGGIASAFQGSGQELLTAGILLLAVVMLAWHNAWMGRHGRELADEVRHVGRDVASGRRSLLALAIVCGVAVLREGSEVVLFLYGIAAAGTSSTGLLVGGLLGIVAGAGFAGLTYYGLLAIPSRHIFAVTGVLITFLAAGMASQAMLYLNSAGMLTAFDATIWDTSWLLPQTSFPGLALKTLIGYSDRPTEMQVIAYLATLIGMMALTRFAAAPRRIVSA